MSAGLDQTQVNRRYDRVARWYDRLDAGMERRVGRRERPVLWLGTGGKQVLEVGIGTGKNLPYVPAGAHVTAIEPSDGMRVRAEARAAQLGVGDRVAIGPGDVQSLPFAAAAFDVALATFVFCSVAEPVRGLREVRRVLKPGGELRLLEHQLPGNRLLAAIFRLLDPLIARLLGFHIARDTEANVRHAGFVNVEAEPLDRFGIVRRIRARAPAAATATTTPSNLDHARKPGTT